MSTAVDVPAPAPSVAANEERPTPVCQALAVAIPLGYVASVVAPAAAATHLAFIPTHTFLTHKYIWNVATHAVAEMNWHLAAVNLAIVFMLGKPLERDWGTVPFLLLLGVAALATAAALLLLTPVLSALFQAPLTSASFGGFLPCAAALIVATWQRSPDAPVAGLSNVRFTHIPVVFMLLCIVHELALGPPLPTEADVQAQNVSEGSPTMPALIGLYAAWFYLRFVKMSSWGAAAATAGDPSPAFAFHAMFPGPVGVVVRALGAAVFPLVQCCGLGAGVAAAGTSRAGAAAAGTDAQAPQHEAGQPLPGTSSSVADRRRQVALAALAQRLERAKQMEAESSNKELDF